MCRTHCFSFRHEYPSLGMCQSPEGRLMPVADTFSFSTKVEVLVATTRSRGRDVYRRTRIGSGIVDITVSIPPNDVRKVGEVAGQRNFPPIRQRISLSCGAKNSPWRQRKILALLSQRARIAAFLCSSTTSTIGSKAIGATCAAGFVIGSTQALGRRSTLG